MNRRLAARPFDHRQLLPGRAGGREQQRGHHVAVATRLSVLSYEGARAEEAHAVAPLVRLEDQLQQNTRIARVVDVRA